MSVVLEREVRAPLVDPFVVPEAPEPEEEALVRVLREARELISDPNRWCTGHYAQTLGTVTDIRDPSAKRFCAVGALYRVAEDDTLAHKAARLLSRVLGLPVVCVNDGANGYERVLRGFDEALAEFARPEV